MNIIRRLLTAAVLIVPLVLAETASASPVLIGVGAFSGTETTITFEDTAGNFSGLPAGYGSGSGISFSANTLSAGYSGYGGTLQAAAASAGLGAIAGTYGCLGSCGSGFSFAQDQTRVGFYFSSNVAVGNDLVQVLRDGNILGSFTIAAAANQIGFIGFEDAGGIDQIIIPGPDHTCYGCIYQIDNIKFETASSVPEPASLALLSLGLFGLGFGRRKKA